MSNETKQTRETREQKRARFTENEASKRGSGAKAMAVVAVVVVVAIAAVLFFAGSASDAPRPTASTAPASSSASPSSTTRPAATTPSPSQPLAPERGAYRIALSDVTTDASFFAANEGGKTVPFFAVRDKSGKTHVALDACSVCAHSKKGYSQAGDAMRCRNCGQQFAIASLTDMAGKGGCHPISLPAREEGGTLVVQSADLAAGAKWF